MQKTFSCSLCGVSCSGELNWTQHLQGLQHAKHTALSRQRVERCVEEEQFFCSPCQLQCSGPVPWQQHLQSGRHLWRLQQQAAAPPAVTAITETSSVKPSSTAIAGGEATAASTERTCVPCGVTCSGPVSWQQHLNSARHSRKTAHETTQDCIPTSL